MEPETVKGVPLMLMLKKLAIGILMLLVIGTAAVYFWADAVLSSDAVRSAVASQISSALGQPVRIQRLRASIFPLAITMDDVRIGAPERIAIAQLHLATSLRGLLSRRVEDGRVLVTHAVIQLPLPPFALGSRRTASASPPSGAGLTIASIDEIALSDLEVSSGGQTLRGSLNGVVHDNGLTITHATISAGQASLDITGEITDLAGPAGDITIKAGTLDMLSLLSVASNFGKNASSDDPLAPAASGNSSSGSPMNLTLTVSAEHATLGALTLDGLSGHARLTPEVLAVDPIAFGAFGGRSTGSLGFTLADTPSFRLRASLADVDMAAVMAFAGHPDLLSGRLSGTLDLSGQGTDASRVLPSTHGTARVEVVDGVVQHLGLVRAIVVATSMRTGSQQQAVPAGDGANEPFSRLGATLAIDHGAARTSDLEFASHDVLLKGAGTIRLDGSATDVSGDVQLSDELSRQAGRDLVRYTQQQGRVTLPVTVTGPASDLHVRVNLVETTKRAIINRAAEEARKAILRGLGR